jgi:hypothetical protein
MTTTVLQIWRIAQFRFTMWRQSRLFGSWRHERHLRMHGHRSRSFR